jgi:hypothetical protein
MGKELGNSGVSNTKLLFQPVVARCMIGSYFNDRSNDPALRQTGSDNYGVTV